LYLKSSALTILTQFVLVYVSIWQKLINIFVMKVVKLS